MERMRSNAEEYEEPSIFADSISTMASTQPARTRRRRSTTLLAPWRLRARFYIFPADDRKMRRQEDATDYGQQSHRFDWFGTLSILVVLLNLVTLALYDPTGGANQSAELSATLSNLEYFFVAFFTLETILRIVCLGARPVFTKAWNLLDVCVVVSSALALVLQSVFPQLSSVSGLRAIRVLRPMRAFSRIPEIRVVINSMVKSLRYLADVGALYLLFVIAMGCAGIALFAGQLERRCVRNEYFLFDVVNSSEVQRAANASMAVARDCGARNVASWPPTTDSLNHSAAQNNVTAAAAAFQAWLDHDQLSATARRQMKQLEPLFLNSTLPSYLPIRANWEVISLLDPLLVLALVSGGYSKASFTCGAFVDSALHRLQRAAIVSSLWNATTATILANMTSNNAATERNVSTRCTIFNSSLEGVENITLHLLASLSHLTRKQRNIDVSDDHDVGVLPGGGVVTVVDDWTGGRSCDVSMTCDDGDDPMSVFYGVSCPYGYTCSAVSNPAFGFMSFDNIGFAILTVLTTVTTEPFPVLLSSVSSATTKFTGGVYGVVLIVVGSLFIVNLLVALISVEFEKCRTEEAVRRQQDAVLHAAMLPSSFTSEASPKNINSSVVVGNGAFRVHLDRNQGGGGGWALWNRMTEFRRERSQRNKVVSRFLKTKRKATASGSTPQATPNVSTLTQRAPNEKGEVSDPANTLTLSPPGGARPKAVLRVSFAGSRGDALRSPHINQEESEGTDGPHLFMLPPSFRHDNDDDHVSTIVNSEERHEQQTQQQQRLPHNNVRRRASVLDRITAAKASSTITTMDDISSVEWLRFHVHTRIVNTRAFYIITSMMMIIMLISMSIQFYGMPQDMSDALDVVNLYFTIFITVEITVRLVASDPVAFFSSGEQLTGMLVLVVSWIDVASTNFNLPVIRALRLVVAVKLLRYFPTLYGHLLIMVNSFRASLILVCVIALELFIFACLGMQVLGGRSCNTLPDSRFLGVVESGQLATTTDWLPWDNFFLPTNLQIPVAVGGLATFQDYAQLSLSTTTSIANNGSSWWDAMNGTFPLIPSLTAASLPQDSLLCTPMRLNFDTFGYAMLSSFSILASDNWNDLMAQSLTTYNDGVPFALVAGLFCLQYYAGVYVLLNLFIAILMSSTEKLFGDAAEGRDDDDTGGGSDSGDNIHNNSLSDDKNLGGKIAAGVKASRTSTSVSKGKDFLLEHDAGGGSDHDSGSGSSGGSGSESSGDDFLSIRKKPSILSTSMMRKSRQLKASQQKTSNNRSIFGGSTTSGASAVLAQSFAPAAMNLNDFFDGLSEKNVGGNVNASIHFDENDVQLAALDAREQQQGLISLAASLPQLSSPPKIMHSAPSHRGIEPPSPLSTLHQTAARVLKLQRRALIEHQQHQRKEMLHTPLPRPLRASSPFSSSHDNTVATRNSSIALVQQKLLHVLDHPVSNACMILVVLTSTIALALETITLPPDASTLVTLSIIDDVCSGVFILEFCLRVFGRGLRQTFLGKTPWNWLEALLVISNIVDLVLSHGFRNERNVAHIVRTLYVLRPLRILRRTAGIRIVARSLLGALRPLKDVVVVGFVVYVIAAIMGVQLFAGAMRSCSNSPRPILTEVDCIAAGYTWENTGFNFDNLGQALLSLFVVSSLEKWQDVLFAAMDSVDAGIAPQKDANPVAALYVLTFAVIGGFFFVSLFVSVLIRSYEREKSRLNRISLFLTEAQEQWLSTQRSVLASMPLSEFLSVPSNERHSLSRWSKIRAVMIQVSLHPAMHHVVSAAVVASMVGSAAQHYPRTDGFDTALNTVNTVVTAVYLAEAMIKLIAVHPELYFSSSWNRFDFLILLVSIADVALAYSSGTESVAGVSRALRLFRAARLLRLAQSSKRLSRIVAQFTHSLYGLMNVAAFLVLLVASYALATMWTFGALFKDGTVVTVYQNFDTFINAAMSLMQLLFGGDWSIMTACSRGASTINLNTDLVWEDTSICTDRIGNCGNEPLAIILFISYFILGRYVLLNIFIAVIVESFRGDERGSGSKHAGAITEGDIKAFVETWVTFDRDRRLYLATRDLVPMLQCLPSGHPFAPPPDRMRPPAYDAPPRQRRRYLVQHGFGMLMFLAPLGLEERHGCVEFFDVLTALLRHVTKCETVDALVEPARAQFERQFRFRLQCRVDPSTIAMAEATAARRRERAVGQERTAASEANRREVLVRYSAAFLADVWKGCASIRHELAKDRTKCHQRRSAALMEKEVTDLKVKSVAFLPKAITAEEKRQPEEPTTLLSRLRRDHLNWRANSQNRSRLAEDKDQLVELETLLLGDDALPSSSSPVTIDDAHFERDTAVAMMMMIPARKAITVSTLSGRGVVIEKPMLPPPLPAKGTASFLWTATNSTTDGPLQHAEQQYVQQQQNNNNHYHNQDGPQPPRNYYTRGGGTTASNNGVVDLWAYVDAVGNNNNHSAPAAALTALGFSTTTTTVRRPSSSSSLLFSTPTAAPPSHRMQGTSDTTRQLSNY
ncbi:voltage-gated ion channel protein, putative [Bodo saltans]|uniref:Voltage-gated ion channel protein, putative n=1 Tax=Bodo saltans TaxID=75058 RepID=A0A0S4JAM2_BODSA|nr:voltage-gated ion channel protein, putative [Bodo saltans]|eukprot:CUG88426.1 voltage-gated ion channel protein, putative [Bodo saltans]